MIRSIRRAEIVAVGSELLTPHRLDTNSLYLTGQLNELGVVVRMKSVVGDDREDLAMVVRQALSRADLVITTGGLGPTADDVTRDVVADLLGLPLDEDAEILAAIRVRFERRGLQMPDINRRQALVPRGATPLANAFGTAPGLLIDTGDCSIALLPGPPRELRPMFEAQVAPRIAEASGGIRLRRRVIKVIGRSESQVEEIAFPIYSAFASGEPPIATTILATPGQIELHLSAAGTDPPALEAALKAAAEKLASALGPSVFTVAGETLEAVVGAMLQTRGWRIAVAESCTGGTLLGRLTDVPGSSAWVLGGVVAYANDVKIRELAVPPRLLAEHGAVSEPVAQAMAAGVKAQLEADLGVAITGIAGPGGGSPEKPVGTVVVAVVGSVSLVRTLTFPGDREAIRRHATSAALDLVRRSLAGPSRTP